MITTEKTVKDLVLENPAATRVFEGFGIDYCCGAQKTLEEACRTAGVPIGRVLDSLAAAPAPSAAEVDWQSARLSDLVAHITATHHQYTRGQIARLGTLFDKVCAAHGKNHPELFDMRKDFFALGQELMMHLQKEEMVLFPFVVRMEEERTRGAAAPPSPFGTVANPVSMMMHEHDAAGEVLHAMRTASSGYAVPDDACLTYRSLYRELVEFEADLHQHIHLENNILFPRAIGMERA